VELILTVRPEPVEGWAKPAGFQIQHRSTTRDGVVFEFEEIARAQKRSHPENYNGLSAR
jgi:hypothetical protein